MKRSLAIITSGTTLFEVLISLQDRNVVEFYVRFFLAVLGKKLLVFLKQGSF